MYFFYIDESDEIDYNSKGKYFVYNALGFDSKIWRDLNNQVNTLKSKIFSKPLSSIFEIKSHWIRHPEARKKVPYLANLPDNKLKQLSLGMFNIITSNDLVLICIVVNKDAMLKQYGINASKPNLFAMEYLLEKISLFMDFHNSDRQAIVMMDKFSDESEQLLNKAHMLQINHSGYTWKNLKIIVENLLFVDSKYNNFIQLTDLCAYSIMRAFRDDNPEYPFFKKIISKFAADQSNMIINSGITYKLKEYLKIHNPRMDKFLNEYVKK
ncbi:MAG: hypothetical protein A2Y25_04590 [Candidatus Melainabacteria bacterium GWF2_37_15]|nr:MAG: hypothetical protein A2Y25_04590 [Candidatus Melainabacteria bacterium GWF2_37_15]